MKNLSVKGTILFLALCSTLHQPALEASNTSYSMGSKILAASAITAGSFYLLRNQSFRKRKSRKSFGNKPMGKNRSKRFNTRKIRIYSIRLFYGALAQLHIKLKAESPTPGLIIQIHKE